MFLFVQHQKTVSSEKQTTEQTTQKTKSVTTNGMVDIRFPCRIDKGVKVHLLFYSRQDYQLKDQQHQKK